MKLYFLTFVQFNSVLCNKVLINEWIEYDSVSV